VIGGCRKLHNEELCNFYSSLSTIRMIKLRRIRWARHVARIGGKGCILFIGGKARRKETIKKPRHMWVNNIKMDLGDIG
jgi:hypothetical protein